MNWSWIIAGASLAFMLRETWRTWRYYQRHKVRCALLKRCDIYIARQRQAIEAGRLDESRKLHAEVDELLNQVKESLKQDQ